MLYDHQEDSRLWHNPWIKAIRCMDLVTRDLMIFCNVSVSARITAYAKST
jgi:hypothetical protein